MDFFGKIEEIIRKNRRLFKMGMAVVLLLCACFFARESFWEMTAGRADKSRESLVILDAGHGGETIRPK